MRGGRDYINDLANVSECNPYGLNRNTGACDLVKNTELPDPGLYFVETGNALTHINEGTNGISTSRYDLKISANWLGYVTYKWAVVNCTVIAGGKTNDKFIEVQTLSDQNETFNIDVDVSDQKNTHNLNQNFTHEREVTIIPITATGITESIAGSCDSLDNVTCLAESTHTVEYLYDTGPVTFLWILTGAGVTITSGQGTDTVVVSSTEKIDLPFTLECQISDDNSADAISDSFVHDRTATWTPVVLTALVESVAGSCQYEPTLTCIAESTYVATVSDYVTLTWVVTGATIISGQGTPSIVVQTTGDVTSLFNVAITATGAEPGDSLSLNGDYSHFREEVSSVFDETLLYDNTNIATEFIA